MRFAGPVAVVLIALSLSAGEPPAAPPKRIPPPGIEPSPAERAALEQGLAALRADLDAASEVLAAKPALRDLLADAEIHHKAVGWALRWQELQDKGQVGAAAKLIEAGRQRAKQLAEGKAPWAQAPGLVVRAYRSRIDGSLQPYGLVVPPGYAPGARRWRLDLWFHGRDEKLTELKFLLDRQKDKGQFVPKDAIVLHCYGRFCNASKLAGETDAFEALEDVKRRYAIDEDRISVRGFSMGGATVWHLAVHHAGLWAAAAPGAGFAETPRFAHLDVAAAPWWQRSLWRQYDATDWAANLAGLPLIAYSGENDKQKQAAEVMAEAMALEGLTLRHVVGPGTAHAYHPESKKEIDAFVDAAAAKGRDPCPQRIRFTTWTLKYPRLQWVRVEALGRHWERARCDAEIADRRLVKALTVNVEALTFEMPANARLAPRTPIAVEIDGQRIEGPAAAGDGSWRLRLRRVDGRWQAWDGTWEGPRKTPGLQGPIDDAFTDSFAFVRPTGEPRIAATAAWIRAERERAAEHWRRILRGEAREVDDVAVDDALIRDCNLVLWGDPGSNRVLARIADRLPLRWEGDDIVLGARRWSAASHVPVLIVPNPLHPARYVVLNSGITWWRDSSASNALHVPQLPDWAVVAPGEGDERGVADAGFFGERWEALPAPAP